MMLRRTWAFVLPIAFSDSAIAVDHVGQGRVVFVGLGSLVCAGLRKLVLATGDPCGGGGAAVDIALHFERPFFAVLASPKRLGHITGLAADGRASFATPIE